MSLFDKLLGWVRDKAAAWAERRASANAARLKGLGERIMAGSMMGGGWGTGGLLYQDRLEQVQHFKHWSYVAINCRANLIAGLKPNIAYVHEKPDPQGGKGHKSLLARHRYEKSLRTIQDHEEIEPVSDDHPLRRLLMNPNAWDVASDLWYEKEMFLDLTGEAYAWKVPSEGKSRGISGFGPAELFVLPSQWVYPQLNANGIDYYEIHPFTGPGSLRLPPSEVIAFKCKSPLHKLGGHSPQTAGAEWIDAAESVDRSRFWSNKNGCFPAGVLEMDKEAYPHDPDEADLNRLLAKFYARLQGEEKFGLPVALPPGLTYKPLSVSPTEMAYFQTAEQLRDFVLALWGVPKECVGIQPGGSELSWYAPLEQMCRFTISPRLRYFGEVLTRGLASEWDREENGQRNRRGRLRIWWDDPTPDNPTVVNAALALDAANGWITPNEARAIRGREAYPNGGNNPMLAPTLAPVPWVEEEEALDLSMFEQASSGTLEPANGTPEGEADPAESSPVGKRFRFKAEPFDEGKHPRADDGKFGSGGGSGRGDSGRAGNEPSPATSSVKINVEEKPLANGRKGVRLSVADDEKSHLRAIVRADAVRIKSTFVSEDHRGKGWGLALYEEAIRYASKAGLALESDEFVSRDAVRVWDALERRGYAVVRHPATPDSEGGLNATQDKGPVFSIAAPAKAFRRNGKARHGH